MKQLEWRIRLACAERNIWSAAELRHLVYRRTGVRLSPQTVQACFHGLPARIDVRTLTAILNALACPLEEVIRFTPPASNGEARATAEEAARYRRSQPSDAHRAPHAASGDPQATTPQRVPKGAQAKAKARMARPPADRARMLAALAEGAEPVAAEHLQTEATQSATAARLKKKGADRR